MQIQSNIDTTIKPQLVSCLPYPNILTISFSFIPLSLNTDIFCLCPQEKVTLSLNSLNISINSITVSINTWQCQKSASFSPAVAHFSPARLLQRLVGEVLSNVEAAQGFLDTNTTLIIKTVSRAVSHMSVEKMWCDKACVRSVE